MKRSTKPMYEDCLGVPFEQYHEWLAPSLRDWAEPAPVRDSKVVSLWRSKFVGRPCWWCEGSTREIYGHHVGELHHLHAAGGKKSDEPWLFTFLCAGCHRHGGEAVKAESLGRLLFFKWHHDKENLIWDRLAIRLHCWLPELITDSAYQLGLQGAVK